MASLGQTTEAVLGNLDAALRGEPQPSVSWSPSKSNLSVAPGTAELTTGVKSEDSVGELPICSGSASEGQTTSCLSYSSTVVKHHGPTSLGHIHHQGQERKPRPWRGAAYWLPPPNWLSLLSSQTGLRSTRGSSLCQADRNQAALQPHQPSTKNSGSGLSLQTMISPINLKHAPSVPMFGIVQF